MSVARTTAVGRRMWGSLVIFRRQKVLCKNIRDLDPQTAKSGLTLKICSSFLLQMPDALVRGKPYFIELTELSACPLPTRRPFMAVRLCPGCPVLQWYRIELCCRDLANGDCSGQTESGAGQACLILLCLHFTISKYAQTCWLYVFLACRSREFYGKGWIGHGYADLFSGGKLPSLGAVGMANLYVLSIF